MSNLSPAQLLRVLTGLACLLILKVTAVVVFKYVNYFPPNFEADFLHGRQSYFFGSYQWAFYPHIAVGPVTLIVGMLLLCDRFRRRFPNWHRYLGRFQALTVLVVLVPTGLWMAYRAQPGPVAGLGLATLAVITGTTVTLGWRRAVQRRFTEHRRWMLRCYLLLCSTIVLRLIAGLATVAGANAPWIDTFAAWGSWILPLAAYEACRMVSRRFQTGIVPSDAALRRATG